MHVTSRARLFTYSAFDASDHLMRYPLYCYRRPSVSFTSLSNFDNQNILILAHFISQIANSAKRTTMAEKTALVTGATGLLGRQVHRAFVRRDWTAKGTGFSRADGATILKLDLASDHEVEKALDAVKYSRPRY